MRWKLVPSVTTLLLLQVLYFTKQTGAQNGCRGQPEIVVAMENSGGDTEASRLAWRQSQQFAISVIAQLALSRPNPRFAFIAFNKNATLSSSFSGNVANLSAIISNTQQQRGENRSIAAAYRVAQQVFFDARNQSDKYLILVVSGVNVQEQETVIGFTNRLKKLGVRIIIIGVGVDRDSLLKYAPSSEVFSVNSYDLLATKITDVATAYSVCPQAAAVCEGYPEIVIILDGSGSILERGPDNWDRMKTFATDLVDRLRTKKDVRMAFILFSDLILTVRNLTSNIADVRLAIQNSQNIGGLTNTADALRAAQTVLLDARSPAAIYVIVITDGAPTQNQGQEALVAQEIRRRGAEIIAIGVTNAINESNLIDLAGSIGSVFLTPTFQSLGDKVPSVITAATICPPPRVECNGDTDVVIILDSSSSITDKGANNWQLMQDFAISIIEGLKNKPNIRFAYIQFSDDAAIISPLTSNITAIKLHIKESANLQGFTDQASALLKASAVFYNSSVGSFKYAIFVTDGVPTSSVGIEIDAAKSLRNQGVSIISIGVTDQRNATNLRGLAGPAGTLFETDKFEDLSGQLSRVISAANLCPEPAKECLGPPEIVIVIDASGSIVDSGSNNWELMRMFGVDLVRGLSSKPDARFAVIRFSNDAVIDTELTSDLQSVEEQIKLSENLGGYTNQYDALRHAQDVLYNSRPGATKIILFITDGSPTKNQGQEARIARGLREQGVLIVAIGVTVEQNATNLREIAGPVGPVFETEDFTSLNDQVSAVITAASICPEQPEICAKPADIILIIDASGSIVDKGKDNWPLMQRFATSIIDGLKGKSGSKFAVVRFSNEAYVDSPLSADPEKVKAITANSSNLGGYTNQYDALLKSQEIFYSGRNDAARYIVFVTDGEPTTQVGRESRLAASLRRQGVKIIMIGVTKNINETNLYDLAGDSGIVFLSNRFEDLGGRVANVLTASNICPPPPEPCDGPPELVFILDSSATGVQNGSTSWQVTKVYATTMLDELKKRTAIRFGLIKFGGNIAVTERNLTSDVNDTKATIERSTYLGGESNLEAALYASQTLLDESRGHAARYILLITHGPGNNTARINAIISRLQDQGILIIVVWIKEGQKEGTAADEVGADFKDLTSDRGAYFEATSAQPNPVQIQQIIASTNVCPGKPEACYVTNIVFALDSSGYIRDRGGSNFSLMKEFIISLARGISYGYPQAKFGLVVFSNTATIIMTLNNTGLDEFVQKTRAVSYVDGDTNLADAIEKSWNVIERTATEKSLIVVVMDGEPTVRVGDEVLVARNVRSFGVSITAIGVTKEVNNRTLENIAGTTDRAFYSPTFQDLTNQVTPVLRASCERPPTAGSCLGEPDIVFIIDASVSKTEQNSWLVVKNLISKSITQFAKGNPNARFGAVVFSDNAEIVFKLTRSVNVALKGISDMPYYSSNRNIAAGIRLGRTSVFNETRANANKIMILLTNGKSNIEKNKELDEAEITRGGPFNIRVICLGVTDEPDYPLLQQMASDSSSLIRSPSYEVLSSELDRVINVSCSNRSCDGPPDIVLVLDSSGSITDKGKTNWRFLQNFAFSLLDGLVNRPDPRFAYVQFSDNAIIREFFTRDVDVIKESIRASSHMNGWTNQAAALRATRDIYYDARVNASKYCIFITDGYPTVEIGAESGVARLLRDLGTRIIMIGVTNDTNEVNLRDLAGYNGAWFYSKSFESLSNEVYGVIAAADICPGPPGPCSAREVFIVMQVTQNLTNNAIAKLKAFASNITRSIYKRYPDVRFGLIVFNAAVTPILDVKNYRSIGDIDAAIQSIQALGNGVDIAKAISETRSMIERQATRASQMIIVSYQQSNLQEAFKQAILARGIGIKIVAVGISTEQGYYDFLLGLTTTPNNTLLLRSFDDLETSGPKVVEMSCAGSRDTKPLVECKGPSDIVFALDASGSITERNPNEWQNAKDLLYSAIQLIVSSSNDTRFGVVVFSTSSDVEFKFQSNVNDALNGVQAIRYRGSRTNIAAAIEMAREEVFKSSRPNARKLLVVITDGKANERVNEEFVQASISQGYPYNISIIVIGITAEPDYATLEQLASDPNKVIRSANFAILANEVQRVVNVACSPTNDQDVILDNPFDPTCAPLKLDVIFLVDSSGSILKNDPKDLTWSLIKDIIAGIVDRFPSNLGTDGVQIGLAQYSDYGLVDFTLNRYNSPLKIKSRISQLTNMRWSTNTTAGLYLARQYMLTPEAGKRRNTNSVIILISDGEPERQHYASKAEANEIRKLGTRLMVVAVTSNLPSSQRDFTIRDLQDLASERNLYLDLDDVTKNRSLVNEKLCNLK